MRKTFSCGDVVVLKSEAWLWDALAIPPRLLTVTVGNDGAQDIHVNVVSAVHFDAKGNLQTNLYKVDAIQDADSLNKFTEGWPSRPC